MVAELRDVKFDVVEPNISSHPDFDIVNFQTAFKQSDIVVYLTAHKEFFTLPNDMNDKQILDFCGVIKK